MKLDMMILGTILHLLTVSDFRILWRHGRSFHFDEKFLKALKLLQFLTDYHETSHDDTRDMLHRLRRLYFRFMTSLPWLPVSSKFENAMDSVVLHWILMKFHTIVLEHIPCPSIVWIWRQISPFRDHSTVVLVVVDPHHFCSNLAHHFCSSMRPLL